MLLIKALGFLLHHKTSKQTAEPNYSYSTSRSLLLAFKFANEMFGANSIMPGTAFILQCYLKKYKIVIQ